MNLADFIKTNHPAAVAYRKVLRTGDEATKSAALAELCRAFEQEWQKDKDNPR